MKRRKKSRVLLLVIAVCLLYSVCTRLHFLSDVVSNYETANLRVHFIDVGQADCTLIQLPGGETMLIDAGNNENGTEVVDYVREQGIDKIDYLVGTHPHADHIGGLDDVILGLDIGKIYMPKVQSNTKTFREVLEAAQKKNMKIKTARAGVEILNKENLTINIVAPNSDEYEELNDYSAVIRLVYGENAFLFTGDAEEVSEKEIVGEVHADVLKVGHHGSSSSTSDAFLQKVSPTYAYIPCGEGNSYGHPHRETVQKLQTADVTIYRADKDGTVIFDSDGVRLEVQRKWR